jgi:uncharacterized protein (DUF302 family)
MIDYGFTKTVDLPLGAAIDKVTAELAREGFGILTRIDVHEKLKEKIGVDFPPYVILGACHPASAHVALEAEPNIGLMLPCNVCVYEAGGRVTVAVIKPKAAMQAVGNEALSDVAEDIEAKLAKVFAAVS